MKYSSIHMILILVLTFSVAYIGACNNLEQKDGEAEYQTGVKYASGEGVSTEYSEAAKWYRKASDRGYAPAQCELGFLYAQGLGVPPNDDEAVKWFRLSAEQGYAKAQFNLALMINIDRAGGASALGSQETLEEMLKWYRKAAEQEYYPAMYNLGTILANSPLQSYRSEGKMWQKRCRTKNSQAYDKPIKEQQQKKSTSPIGDVSKANKHNLFQYIEEGDLNKVNAILATNPDLVNRIGKGDYIGLSPLHISAFQGRNEIVDLLISKGADVNVNSIDHGTPLHGAATREVAESLISKGADINAVQKNNMTPLHGASFRGNIDVAELLLDKWADPSCPDHNNQTAIDYAKDSKTASFLQTNAKSSIKDDPYSCLPQYMAIINYVRESSVNSLMQQRLLELLDANPYVVNAKAHRKMTPLHFAAIEGNMYAIRLLVAKGAIINAKNDMGKSPVDVAKNRQIADFLRTNIGKRRSSR